MPQKHCRYGAKCTRPDCHFAHPPNRIILSGAKAVTSRGSKTLAKRHEVSITSTIEVKGASTKQCRDGAMCSRPDCKFSHPARRAVNWSSGGPGNSSGVCVKITEVTERSQPPTLGASFVIDVSASMDCTDGEGCTRLEAAMSGMQGVFKRVLNEHDRAELITFSTSCHKHFGLLCKKKIDMGRALRGVRECDRSATAFYDAIKYAIDTSPRDAKFKDLQRELVVLTDGQDNSSSTSLKQVRELVAHPGLPNFHLVVIGVGLSGSAKSNVQSICQPQHCTFLDVRAKPSQIAAAFKRAQGEIIKRREVHVSAWAEGPRASRANVTRAVAGTVRALSRPVRGGNVALALPSKQ